MHDPDLIATLETVVDPDTFSGVVRLERDGAVTTRSWGFADRAHRIPNEVGTRFGIASGVKGITALTVMSLVERGDLALDTTARSLLGDDLPLIDDRVTVEHLLAHRSGIGDFLDEEVFDDVTEYVLAVPVHQLDRTERYLDVLDGHAQVSEPGGRFAYNNGGYVVLALIAERTTGCPFPDLVRDVVLEPAGMTATAFLRSDELPGDAAIGYLGDGPRSNVLHLPVVGSGDGGIYSTASDIAALWQALFDGVIVSHAARDLMLSERSRAGEHGYGLGFWLDAPGRSALEGCDAGVSFRTVYDAVSGISYVVLSNTSEGAWPVARELDRLVFG